MSERLRAMIGVFEQKVTGGVKTPGSLKVPSDQTANEECSEDQTPTKQPDTEAPDKPLASPANREPVLQPSRRDTAIRNIVTENGTLKKNLSKKHLSPRNSRKVVAKENDNDESLSENRTLKKNPSKKHLSPRNSRKVVAKENDDEETLSESSYDDDFDDEEIILNTIQTQDYEALIDFMSIDELDANELTSEGRRYLHECVVYDDQVACDILLDAGAHINARDVQGWTALHYAAAFALTDMTQYLLDRGADPRKKDKKGQTAEDITEDPDIVQKLQVARARRGLRSISTVSTSDIEAAQEEYRRRTEERGRDVRREGET